jgi:hypothetical protein
VVYVIGGLGLTAAGAQPRPNPLVNVLALAGGSRTWLIAVTRVIAPPKLLYLMLGSLTSATRTVLLAPTVRSQSQGHKRPAIYATSIAERAAASISNEIYRLQAY